LPSLLGGYGGGKPERAMIARYQRLFRSSPEAAILAVYGLVHLVVLLVTAEAEPVRSMLHALGVK
jgi:hypothetical protein